MIDGFCREESDAHLPQDIVNVIHVFGKQLWTNVGGKYFELFDLVYHSMKLPPKIVRTYLHQIIEEIEKNPNMAVIEPTDLLLDETFTLFIVSQVNKTNVSTYLAPELLDDERPNASPTKSTSLQPAIPSLEPAKTRENYLELEKYSHKCAIFSIGVILFILLVGNIPFELAKKSDKWYKMLLQGKYDKYWKKFKAYDLSNEAKEMLENMLTEYDKRWDINKIKQCAFYKADIYQTSEDIIARFKYHYNCNEEKRRKMIVDNYQNIYKVSECLNINQYFDIEECKMFPTDEIEGIFDVYVSGFAFKKIYYCLSQVIEEQYQGSSHFLSDKQEMICHVKTDRDKLKFGIKIYESKRWKIAHKDDDFCIDDEEYEPLYVVRCWRIEGDAYEFLKVKNLGLLTCADIMSGLQAKQRRALRVFYTALLEKQKKNKDVSYHVVEMPMTSNVNLYNWY